MWHSWAGLRLSQVQSQARRGWSEAGPGLFSSREPSLQSSPGAQHPFASKENLANVNRASEPCLPLGPGRKLPWRGWRAWWRPV